MPPPSEREKPKNQDNLTPGFRCFLAISLNESIKEQLFELSHKLQNLAWAKTYRWVAPDNWHLTLKFLGYIPQTELQTFSQVLSYNLAKQKVFNFQLESVGCLPSIRKPRVLVVSLKHSVKLLQLAEDLENMARAQGLIAEQRQFHPHITLARCKQKKPASLKTEFPAVEPVVMQVQKITLLRSQLSSNGAQYSVITEYPLQR